MTSMVEIVAMELTRATAAHFGDPMPVTPDLTLTKVLARAAIAAMRTATEEMEKAGFGKTRVEIRGAHCHSTDCPLGALWPGPMFRNVWVAMIDAALSPAVETAR